MKKINAGNKLYYVQILNSHRGFLNAGETFYSMGTKDESGLLRTKFTLEEIEKINPKLLEFAVPVEDE